MVNQNRINTTNLEVVKHQDWRVDRKYPSFVNDNLLEKLNLGTKSQVLHLGFGDGSCAMHIQQLFPEVRQTGYANAVYSDWFEVYTKLSQKYFTDKPDKFHKIMGEILRNNLLLDPNFFSFETVDHVKPFSSQEMLNYAINNIPKYTNKKYSRGKCGKKIIEEEYNCEENRVLKYYPELDSKFLNRFENYFYSKLDEKMSALENIIFGDFLNIESKLENNTKYELILSTRADAFLGKEYFSFLERLIPYLSENGTYISDGIRSAYTYEFNETRFNFFKEKYASKYNIEHIFEKGTENVVGIKIENKLNLIS
jgi:hypothetical protein